jgi:hypothetical protein
MTTEKQIAALIQAGADPVLIGKIQQLPIAAQAKIVEAAEEVVEEVKERKGRRKGA